MEDKIKFLFKPYLLIFIGLAVGYTFLHWLVFIELKIISLKEVFTNLVIPMILAGIVSWVLMRPKLKVLNLESKRGNRKDFYCFILWIILTIPLFIAQEYMVRATGKLTELNSINEINQKESTKYYTLKNFYIDKKVIGFNPTNDVSGKHNESLNFHIYITLPIFESANDTTVMKPLGWLGIEFRETINNRQDPKEKEEEYQHFIKESLYDFGVKNVSDFVYLERIGNSDERDGYMDALRRNPVYDPCNTVLVARNEPFEDRNGNKLAWFFCSSLIGSIIWLIMLFIPSVDKKQLNRIKQGKPDKDAQEEIKEFIDFLKPKEGFFITPILIYANIGIYLFLVMKGLGFISVKGQDLLHWGANYGPLTKGGEWWRLLTNVFLHSGLMHLLANMYGLLFVGIFLEPLLGRTKYLTIYLLTGILASMASIWWYEATISVGASGAIFGLYGLFLALLLMKVFPPDFGKAFLLSTLVFVGINLLMGLTGGIDNAAHIGGLISGFVIGLFLYPILKERIQIEKEDNRILNE